MDIVVIGKRSFNRNDRPEVVYCGQSWDEARAAVNAKAGEFVNFYQISAEPYRPLRPDPVAAKPDSAPAPEAATSSKKKKP